MTTQLEMFEQQNQKKYLRLFAAHASVWEGIFFYSFYRLLSFKEWPAGYRLAFFSILSYDPFKSTREHKKCHTWDDDEEDEYVRMYVPQGLSATAGTRRFDTYFSLKVTFDFLFSFLFPSSSPLFFPFSCLLATSVFSARLVPHLLTSLDAWL